MSPYDWSEWDKLPAYETTTPLLDVAAAERERFVAERGTTMDIVHDLVLGTAAATDILAAATDSEELRKGSDWLQRLDIALPDTSQYYGTQGRLGRVVDIVVQSAPLTVGLGATAGAGALVGGPVGGYVAGSAAFGALGRGLFQQSMDEIERERPDLSQEEKFRYSITNAGLEVGSEFASLALPFLGGKILGTISKPAKKAVLQSLVDSGRVSAGDILSTVVKGAGSKEAIKAILGGAAVDGLMEVANELGQAANREAVDLEAQPVDLIDIFLAGSAPGAVVGGVTVGMDARSKKLMQDQFASSLASEDIAVRQRAAEDLTQGLANVHPELADAVGTPLADQAAAGPVSLETILEQQKEVEVVPPVEEKILQKPEESLRENNIDPETGLHIEGMREGFEHITARPAEIVTPTPERPLRERVEDEMYRRYQPEVPGISPEIREVMDFMETSAEYRKEKNQLVTGMSREEATRYMDALRSAKTNEAKREAIRQGMREVVEMTNQLEQPGRSLAERKTIKREKDKTIDLIEEEVEEIVPRPVKPVAPEVKPPVKPEVKPEVPVAPEVVKPEVPVEEPVVPPVKPEVKPKPEVPKEPEKPVEVKPEVPPKDWRPLNKEVKELRAKLDALDKFKPTDPEKLAEWKEKRGEISAEFQEKRKELRAIPEYREAVQRKRAKKAKEPAPLKARVEKGTTTKGKQWKVVSPKTAEVLRASTKKEAQAAADRIDAGKPHGLLPFEEKKAKGFEVRKLEKLSPEAKQEVATFVQSLDNEVEIKKKKTTIRKHILTGGKKLQWKGVQDAEGSLLAEAIVHTAERGQSLTPGNVRTNLQKVINVEANRRKVEEVGPVGEVFAEAEVKLAEEKEAPTVFVPKKKETLKEKAGEVRKLEAAEDFKVQPRGDVYDVVDTDGSIVASGFKDPLEAMEFAARGRAGSAQELMDPAQEVAERWKQQAGSAQKAIIRIKEVFGIKPEDPGIRKALETLEKERDEIEVRTKAFTSKYSNGHDLMKAIATKKIGQGMPHVEMAKWLLEKPKIAEKLKKVKVFAVTSGSSYYLDGGVYINVNKATQFTHMHELVHAITVEEMRTNPEMQKEVRALLEEARAFAVKEGWITPVEMQKLKEAKTSRGFQEGGQQYKHHAIAYGLLNEQEFLSQSFDKPDFQNFLKSMKIRKKTMWERLKDIVAKAFGLTGEDYTMLERVMTLIPEIGQMDPGLLKVKHKEPFASADYVVKTDEATAAVMRKEKQKEGIKRFTFDTVKDIKKLAEDIARPVSDRIREVSPKLWGSLMTMETRLMTKQKEYSTKVKPFLKWYKGLTRSQQVRYSFALMNSQTSENKKIIAEIPKDVYKGVKEVLDDLYSRAEDVGLAHGSMKEDYFPRRINDIAGFMDAMSEGKETRGALATAFDKEAERLGVPSLTDAQKAQVVTDQFQSGYFRQLPRPGAMKKRSVDFVSPETFPFYSGASDSLTAHIFEMNEKVGQREFIGGSARRKRMQELYKEAKRLEEMKEGPKKDLAVEEYRRKAEELEDIEKDLQEQLGALVAKELKDKNASEQMEVVDLINARLRQKGAHGVMDAFRNVSYMATMGNFLSAITQLGDIPIIFYAHGLNMDSLSAVGEAFREVYKIAKGEITGKDIATTAFVKEADFTNTLREFSEGKVTADLLEKLFKYSGLKFTDLIGKEAFMRAAYKKYQKVENRDIFMEKYTPMFGPEGAAKVLKDIQLGKKNDEITSVLIAELSDFQPISLSQQPKGYLGAGNMRIFYMLKTFTLRTTSAALREGVNEAKKGNVAKGVGKVAAIIGIYALAGAGADELKDLLRGRESSITDNTMDNILQMFFLSRYQIEKGRQQDGIVKGILNNMLPPVRFMDSFIADVDAIASSDKDFKFKSLQTAPLVGTMMYSRSEPGQETFARMERKAILERVAENKKKRKGAYSGQLSKRIREYNRTVGREERITNDTVMRAYRRD